MSLEIDRHSVEVEELIGFRASQVLVRAEALVPGAGREAIEPLLADASLFLTETDLQADRMVVEGTVRCQAVYRQGEEATLRALTAQTTLNHVIDIPGTEAGMLARVRGEVEHVDVRYENGHMIFQITCGLRAQALRLAQQKLIEAVEGMPGLETAMRAFTSVRMAAESSEMALLEERVALPAALDARVPLMDWATVEVEETEPDLGGVRVKGRVLAETLVSSGAEGRPAVLVRYPLALDQLVELPEWLTGDVTVDTSVRSVETHIEPGDDGEAALVCEVALRVCAFANASESAEALTDIYATQGSALAVERLRLDYCAAANHVRVNDTVRGTVLIGENAPGVGTVIASQVHPSIGEWRDENDHGRIEGVLEVTVLYMPGGSDFPASAQAELPFSLSVPIALNEESMIEISVLSVEANALMSDRLEMKIHLGIACETRRREILDAVVGVEAGETLERRPGIVVCWPREGDTQWVLGKRYAVPAARVGAVEVDKPLVLKV